MDGQLHDDGGGGKSMLAEAETEKSHTHPSPPAAAWRPSSLPPPPPGAAAALVDDDDDDVTYPEGGLRAWLVVLGAWSGLAASLGVYNSTGVIEAYLSRELLRRESPSTIGWIFGVYAFMTWFCGAQVGPTFDAKGPRGLLVAGSLCTLVGIFALSFSTEYYQFILAFSILAGIGSSLLITPAMGSVAHWFSARRGLASGIAFTGGGAGGVLFPLMMQSLLPRVGWAWSIRILGFILLVLCAVSVAFCESRVPPRRRPNGNGTTTWRDTLPDLRIFLDGTGAMSMTTAALFLVDLAYLVPMTYIPSYYLDRQGLPGDKTLSGDAAFAYQLLAVANGSSCFGRYAAGALGDRFGRYNTLIVSLFLCLASVAGFWLPDVLASHFSSTTLLVLFTVLFGFVSGSNVSLTPICLGQLCRIQDYGKYYATCYTVCSLGCLISIPIAGSLLDATGAAGKQRYWAAVVYTAVSYLGALLCVVWVRIRVWGWDWRKKW
ncbi:major facilitator superfamily domain-containing protein [Nemania sp. NC0429]|nr:major facilitator superfamily domain-containing protein [Nemania sp. NC0429]